MEGESSSKIQRQYLALLVGCNYATHLRPLQGCVNDVIAMRQSLLSRFGFKPNNMEIMTDDPRTNKKMPTGLNIKVALKTMIEKSKPGDVLVFYFSGHGTTIPANVSVNKKRESAIVPLDFNVITSVDFRVLVNKLPKGATFVFLADSCSSGGLIDQEKIQIGINEELGDTSMISNEDEEEQFEFEFEPNPKMIPFESIVAHLSPGMQQVDSSEELEVVMVNSFGQNASSMFTIHPSQFPRPLKPDQAILISGCQSNEKSWETIDAGKPCGLFTYALLRALKGHRGPFTNKGLVMLIRFIVNKYRKDQHPNLYCSDKNVTAIFLA